MAIARDNIAAGVAAAGVSSLSWSHTVTNYLANTILTVEGSVGGVAVPTITGVVWDSGGANTALSNTVNAVAASKINGGDGLTTSYFWYLLAPSSGSKIIKATASGNCEFNVGSESLSGVAQTSTFNAASPESNARAANINPTTTVTTASGEWVIDSVSCSLSLLPVPAVGAGQTVIYSTNTGSATSLGCASDQSSSSGTTVMDWTGLTANNVGSSQVCVSIKPFLGPTITTQPVQVTVLEGDQAQFTIAATGTGALSYQWKKNAINVGTDSTTYTIPITVIGDNLSLISCTVTDTVDSLSSTTVYLVVIATGRGLWFRA